MNLEWGGGELRLEKFTKKGGERESGEIFSHSF